MIKKKKKKSEKEAARLEKKRAEREAAILKYKQLQEILKLPRKEIEYTDLNYLFVSYDDKDLFLGEGTFGVVFSVLEKTTGEKFAIKIFKHTEDEEHYFQKEIRFAKYGESKGISNVLVRVYDYGELLNIPEPILDLVYKKSKIERTDPKAFRKHYYIVMEWMYDSFHNLIDTYQREMNIGNIEFRRHSLDFVHNTLQTLIKALYQIIDAEIMLNDIKSANILYYLYSRPGMSDEIIFKFSDYGLSCYSPKMRAPVKHQTPETDIRIYECPPGGSPVPYMFASPEYGNYSGHIRDAGLNIWELGQTLLQFLLSSTLRMYMLEKGGSRKYLESIEKVLQTEHVVVLKGDITEPKDKLTKEIIVFTDLKQMKHYLNDLFITDLSFR